MTDLLTNWSEASAHVPGRGSWAPALHSAKRKEGMVSPEGVEKREAKPESIRPSNLSQVLNQISGHIVEVLELQLQAKFPHKSPTGHSQDHHSTWERPFPDFLHLLLAKGRLSLKCLLAEGPRS